MDEDFFFDHKGENFRKLKMVLTRVTKDYINSWLAREDVIKLKIKALIVRELNLMEVTGRNIVVTDVILKYVMKTLRRDLEKMETEGVDGFDILGGEVRVEGTFCGQRFKGFIDRLDSFHPGQVRVVDYKTGRVLEDDQNIDDGNAEAIAERIFAPDVQDRPKIALQFYIYDLLLPQKRPDCADRQIFNCVYSTSSLFKEAPRVFPKNDIFFQEVSTRLEAMLQEMYDVNIPFRRATSDKPCEYCDFKMICGR